MPSFIVSSNEKMVSPFLGTGIFMPTCSPAVTYPSLDRPSITLIGLVSSSLDKEEAISVTMN
ncbi:unnamed protein product [Chondrus crispus]|uniref:Uncharacterized protein n=1 Tax=Chondrus crispus TaxID=2769 RepID=R7Q8X2_CHOCR|nr:unnamed protein product [Chondrus crispus]CDF33846.1 unnamed protein product [Chondrus crispus]|eukprot:XP_005713665.1 unnamed protein product [Chondrus crispus]